MIKIKSVLNALAYTIALLGFIPLFPYLEAVPKVAVPAALAAGIVIDRNEWPVDRRLSTVVSLFFFLFYATRFTAENVIGPAVNLLVILLAVRLSSEKTARNYLQIYAIALFSLAGVSLFNLSALFLCYFLLMLTLIAASLVFLTFHTSSVTRAVSPKDLKQMLSVALLMPAVSMPLIVVFFFILPRTQYPLWNFLGSSGAKITGFSDKVEPGASQAVGAIRNVAFRVQSPQIQKNSLYWRAIVLNTIEGKAWVRTVPSAEGGFIGNKDAVKQTVFPEPGRGGYLVTLNIPRSVTGVQLAASPDFIYRKRGTAAGHERYEVISSLSDTIFLKKRIDKQLYLQVPAKFSKRLMAVATSIIEKGKDDTDKISLLEKFFVDKRLTYATSDLPVGEDPLDEFLFVKQRGHCEFFASSFAVLLRLSGVPSRLVGGYYGGDYNELGGYYVVTEDMAHVWVEAYIAGRGWVTIDPSKFSLNFSGTVERKKEGFLHGISVAMDAFSYYWNIVVINYDLERQLLLIFNVNDRLKGLSMPGRPGLQWLLLLLPAFPAWLLYLFFRRAPLSKEERILHKFLRRVRHEYGSRKDSSTGLRQLALSLDHPSAVRFAAIYERAVYHDRRLTPAEIQELEVLVRGLRNRGDRTASVGPSRTEPPVP